MTDEQRRKIEENKQRALARRAGKNPLMKIGPTYCMSTLASENNATERRIMENRQKALERKQMAQTSVQATHACFGNSMPSSSKTFSNFQTLKTSVPAPTSAGLRSPSNTKGGSFQCVRGKCVLLKPDTFSIDVGYHSALIEFFKQQKTRSYGEGFQIQNKKKTCLQKFMQNTLQLIVITIKFLL